MFLFVCLFVCILSIILEQSNTVLLSKVKPLCKYCTALDKNLPVLLYMDYPCIWQTNKTVNNYFVSNKIRFFSSGFTLWSNLCELIRSRIFLPLIFGFRRSFFPKWLYAKVCTFLWTFDHDFITLPLFAVIAIISAVLHFMFSLSSV